MIVENNTFIINFFLIPSYVNRVFYNFYLFNHKMNECEDQQCPFSRSRCLDEKKDDINTCSNNVNCYKSVFPNENCKKCKNIFCNFTTLSRQKSDCIKTNAPSIRACCENNCLNRDCVTKYCGKRSKPPLKSSKECLNKCETARRNPYLVCNPDSTNEECKMIDRRKYFTCDNYCFDVATNECMKEKSNDISECVKNPSRNCKKQCARTSEGFTLPTSMFFYMLCILGILGILCMLCIVWMYTKKYKKL
jgi:hypothetical protein